MKHTLYTALAVGILAVAAGVAVAGLPSKVPGEGLRITDVPATTAVTLPPLTTDVGEPAAPSTSTTTVASQRESTTTQPDESAAQPVDQATTVPAPGAGDVTESTIELEPSRSELRERADLTVRTLNAGGPAGVATQTAAELELLGYPDVTPGNADTESDVSNVYFRRGLQAEAVRLAEELGWSQGDVAPIADAPGFESDLIVDLAVVLGRDSR